MMDATATELAPVRPFPRRAQTACRPRRPQTTFGGTWRRSLRGPPCAGIGLPSRAVLLILSTCRYRAILHPRMRPRPWDFAPRASRKLSLAIGEHRAND